MTPSEASEGPLSVSTGGELRLQYDYLRNPEWGQVRQDRRGTVMSRAVLHSTLRYANVLEVHVDLRSALQVGRAQPAPIDEDQLSVHEAWAELLLPFANTRLRVGRQEMALGSGRFLDVREGPNVRLSFDGLSSRSWFDERRLLLMALWPTGLQDGVFDNCFEVNDGQAPRLLGAALRSRESRDWHLELSWLWLDRPAETRHSLGLRFDAAFGPWSFDHEAAVQLGSRGDDSIRAWTLATKSARRFDVGDVPATGRFSANIASGDRDPGDGVFETFDALFPRGNYFGEAAVLGPANFFDVHPTLSVTPLDGMTVTLDWGFYWRLSTEEDSFGPPGNVVIDADPNDGRYVGSNLSVSLEHTFGPHLDASLVYSSFFAGSVVAQATPNQHLQFVQATTRLRF